jgi:NAD(P)-dependent dehydrogenase (short-subunit alcohol dehydrogenase family)
MPTPERFAIKPGQRVLVTAGAAGIGQAIASTFAGAGARVHICDISQGVLDECLSASPEPSPTSPTSTTSHAFLPRWIASSPGSTCSSTMPALPDPPGAFTKFRRPTGGAQSTSTSPDSSTVRVSPYRCCARPVKARSSTWLRWRGALATPLAHRTPRPKWGIIGLTESLAKELGPEGIRVNAILPGIVAGPRMTRVIQARADAAQVDYATMESEFLGKVSLRRMVTAQDVADMVLFLCSPAGRNISGQSLSVCGNVETL